MTAPRGSALPASPPGRAGGPRPAACPWGARGPGASPTGGKSEEDDTSRHVQTVGDAALRPHVGRHQNTATSVHVQTGCFGQQQSRFWDIDSGPLREPPARCQPRSPPPPRASRLPPRAASCPRGVQGRCPASAGRQRPPRHFAPRLDSPWSPRRSTCRPSPGHTLRGHTGRASAPEGLAGTASFPLARDPAQTAPAGGGGGHGGWGGRLGAHPGRHPPRLAPTVHQPRVLLLQLLHDVHHHGQEGRVPRVPCGGRQKPPSPASATGEHSGVEAVCGRRGGRAWDLRPCPPTTVVTGGHGHFPKDALRLK